MKWIQDRLDAITTLSSERASKSFFIVSKPQAAECLMEFHRNRIKLGENHFIFPSDAIRVWLMIASVDFGACSVEQKRGKFIEKKIELSLPETKRRQ